MRVQLPPKDEGSSEQDQAPPNGAFVMTPNLRRLIERVARLARRSDVQLFAAAGRKLRVDSESGSSRAKRAWQAWSEKPALQGFHELGRWLKRLVVLRGRGDDGYEASDNETLVEMLAAVDAGQYASPSVALSAFVSAKKFGRGGTEDSIKRRVRRRALYKARQERPRKADK